MVSLLMLNVRTDVDACDCTQGLYEYRKKHWKLTVGEKSLATLGTRTRISVCAGVCKLHKITSLFIM